MGGGFALDTLHPALISRVSGILRKDLAAKAIGLILPEDSPGVMQPMPDGVQAERRRGNPHQQCVAQLPFLVTAYLGG